MNSLEAVSDLLCYRSSIIRQDTSSIRILPCELSRPGRPPIILSEAALCSLPPPRSGLRGVVINQVGNSKISPSGHLTFFSTNIRNEIKTREIQKWPRARDRTSLISLRCVFFLIQIKHYQIRSNRVVCEPQRRVQIKQHNNYNQLFIQCYAFC
jgi:hypothetical protein